MASRLIIGFPRSTFTLAGVIAGPAGRLPDDGRTRLPTGRGAAGLFRRNTRAHWIDAKSRSDGNRVNITKSKLVVFGKKKRGIPAPQ